MNIRNIWNQEAEKKVREIPIERIVSSPYQPRSRYDLQDLRALTQSIDRYGVLSPLLIREIRGNRYEVVAGERRLRACQQLDLETVPGVVLSVNERDVPFLLLSERLQQVTLSPVEKAEAYDRLLRESYGTPADLAKALGVRVSEVTEPMECLHLSAETRRVMEEHNIDEDKMREAMKRPKEEKKILFSVLQAEIEPESSADNNSPSAMEVYANTIKKTVGMLNLAGATANSERVEKEDCVEYIIRIPK